MLCPRTLISIALPGLISGLYSLPCAAQLVSDPDPALKKPNSVQASCSVLPAHATDLRRASTKESLSSLPGGRIWQARWDLDLDGRLAGEVATRLYRFDVANNQLRIRFVGKDKPLNKKHARMYQGEVVAGQKPIIIWRRDDMDGYAAVYILHLTRPGYARGTWLDNLGNAGDIELILQDRRQTEVARIVCGRVVPPGARVIDFESIPPTDLRKTESPDFLAGHGIAEISVKAPSDKSDLLVRDASRYKNVKAIPTSGKQFFEQRTENPDTHSVTLTFDPPLVHFGFSRIGTTGGSSTTRWKAEAFDQRGQVIDAREEGFLVNSPARAYDFVAPVGRRIRSVTFTSTNNMQPGSFAWSSFSSVPLDDFVLTPAE